VTRHQVARRGVEDGKVAEVAVDDPDRAFRPVAGVDGSLGGRERSRAEGRVQIGGAPGQGGDRDRSGNDRTA